MNYEYRLEDVDPKITESLKKAKEAQKEKEKKAWEAQRRETEQRLPVEQRQS
jgi:hypothetical protein